MEGLTPWFTEGQGSDFKHCKPYVFSAFSINQKFLCGWLCIMTDQTSGYFCIISMTENSMTRTENSMTRTENLFYSSSY